MTSKTKTLTDPDGDKLSIEAYPGGLVIATGRSAASRAVRNIDPAELIAAIREVAGMDDAPKPDPAREYTEEDFANAKFARNKDGRIAARVSPDEELSWSGTEGPLNEWWLSDAEMSEQGWQIATPAPTTARELLAMLPDLCYEPEGDWIPEDVGYLTVWDDGAVLVRPDGNEYGMPSRNGNTHRLLLDPPSPVTPEWYSARIVEARVLGGGHCQWASTTDGMWVSLDGSSFSVHRDYLADVTVIVPGEVEA